MTKKFSKLYMCGFLYAIHLVHAQTQQPQTFADSAWRQKKAYEVRWNARDAFFASQNFDRVLQQYDDDPDFIAQEFAALSFAFILHRERSVDLEILTKILEQYRYERAKVFVPPVQFIQEKLSDRGDVEYFFRPYHAIIQEAKELFGNDSAIVVAVEELQDR